MEYHLILPGQQLQGTRTPTKRQPFPPSYPISSPFSVELVNQLFNNEFALANNIQPSSGIALVPLGIVPAR